MKCISTYLQLVYSYYNQVSVPDIRNFCRYQRDNKSRKSEDRQCNGEKGQMTNNHIQQQSFDHN